jgi:hypothetical protein
LGLIALAGLDAENWHDPVAIIKWIKVKTRERFDALLEELIQIYI